jgi:cytochrome o ubiquinol oxidase operon protein cyoD
MDLYIYSGVFEGIRMSNIAGKHKQGTLTSYVVGFFLSIICVLAPYYLVVHHIGSGNTLLAIIIGLALIQMIIQITFFLHLGRGPKPNWSLFFFASTVGIVVVVVGGSIVIINNLHYNMQPSEQVKKLINDEGIYQVGGSLTGACKEQHQNHQIIIKDGQVNPLYTYANKCDTLTIINQDSGVRHIVFGANSSSQAYAGENKITTSKGRGETITLSQPGTYQLHDQDQSAIAGYFIVNP